MSSAASSPSYMLKLLDRREVAERTMAFHFEKPAALAFKPGQFVEVTLINPPETDEEGNGRAFSIASAPHEDTLMVATRMRDTAFKRVLRSMPLGTEVKVEGPFGNLYLHNNPSRAAVLLVGGIGITPMRSMVLRAAREKLPHRIVVFYSNRRPEDAAFLEEMQQLERENPKYKFVGVMTEMAESSRSWKGETCHISREMLDKYLRGVESPYYYITGPPAMVSGLHHLLNQAGVDDDDIRAEEFAGY